MKCYKRKEDDDNDGRCCWKWLIPVGAPHTTQKKPIKPIKKKRHPKMALQSVTNKTKAKNEREEEVYASATPRNHPHIYLFIA